MSTQQRFWTFYSCGRKTQFVTKEDADRRIKEIKAKGGVRMRTYKCDNCGGWHLAKIKERRSD